jgi:MOSC domain-containing protein YiiM
MGSISAIYVAPSAAKPMEEAHTALVEAGRGIVGDRYHAATGTFSRPGREHEDRRQITLIESEAIAAVARDYDIAFEPRDSRRNLVTRGVALNHLVGAEFVIGTVRLRGIKLCEPCAHLEKVTGLPVRDPLRHRGGLNCEVVEGGTISVGDTVQTG